MLRILKQKDYNTIAYLEFRNQNFLDLMDK